MSLNEPLLMELDREGATTRRVLERIPGDKLSWRPHKTARSLGELGFHIATAQKTVTDALKKASHEAAPHGGTVPETTAGLVAVFDASLSSAKASLSAMSDADLTSPWSLTVGGQPKFTSPKIGVVRTIVLNHIYHHRGQLTVYLRELGVPVPSIYGPSGDENPFA
jgi:uncharacterized damage-inducible protein DinB